MKTIMIGFSNSNTLLSRMIRTVTGSKISHSWLFLPDMVDGVDLVMEALPGGFHIITFERFKRENNVLEIIDLGVSFSESSLKRAFGWIDKRYDYFAVVGMLVVLAGRVIGKKWRNPLTTKSLDCVESVVYFLQSNNFPDSLALDPGSMTPQDLYDFLKK